MVWLESMVTNSRRKRTGTLIISEPTCFDTVNVPTDTDRLSTSNFSSHKTMLEPDITEEEEEERDVDEDESKDDEVW